MIHLEDVTLIGENDYGYTFGVGRLEGRWIGFARAPIDAEEDAVFVFPEVSKGGLLGLTDRAEAIRMSGAVACDPESGYAGIDRWFVDEELRGDPEQYKCSLCGTINCDGGCSENEPDWADEDE